MEPFLGLSRPHSPPSPLPPPARALTPPCLPQPGWRQTQLLTHTHTHTCTQTHTHTESQTFESDFWPIFPPKDSSGPALLCPRVSHLCLWVGLAAFLRAAVFSLAGNLPPHTPTLWNRQWADHCETGLWWGGGWLGESPFQPPNRNPAPEPLGLTPPGEC